MAKILNFPNCFAQPSAQIKNESENSEAQSSRETADRMLAKMDKNQAAVKDILLLANAIGADSVRYGKLQKLTENVTYAETSRLDETVQSYSAEELVGFYRQELNDKPIFLRAILDEIKRRVELMRHGLGE
jgi:hypothetical protein